ncbi:PREDICTED: leucine-twenty homeobox [Condylura cristata]|uniref:leucine-twenty homeobox n=1 Tax=Condylura cristata TaxID=143302 RepID=UPI00064360AC|nr:PREDICTED: leucine-twenty homeobox [Condylura cristata]
MLSPDDRRSRARSPEPFLDPMATAETPKSVRRRRTKFTPEHLGALRDVFQKTVYPSWSTITQLALITGLDDLTIQPNTLGDAQPPDIQDICLQVSDLPWASCQGTISEFMELYILPGNDDSSCFDQYLLPEGSDAGEGRSLKFPLELTPPSPGDTP